MRPLLLLSLLTSPLALRLHSATVFGNLTDISLSPLNTKLLFSPTNYVLVNPAGLSAGPPRLITTTAGAFSLTLDAGEYSVSLPLIHRLLLPRPKHRNAHSSNNHPRHDDHLSPPLHV